MLHKVTTIVNDFLEFPRIKAHLGELLSKELPEGSEVNLIGTDIGRGITKDEWLEIKSLLGA